MNNNTAHLNDAEARKVAKATRRPDRELEEEIQHQLEEEEELLEIGDDESPIEQEEEWRRYLEDANNEGVTTVIRPMTDEEIHEMYKHEEDYPEIEASTCTGGPTGDIIADLFALARREVPSVTAPVEDCPSITVQTTVITEAEKNAAISEMIFKIDAEGPDDTYTFDQVVDYVLDMRKRPAPAEPTPEEKAEKEERGRKRFFERRQDVAKRKGTNACVVCNTHDDFTPHNPNFVCDGCEYEIDKRGIGIDAAIEIGKRMYAPGLEIVIEEAKKEEKEMNEKLEREAAEYYQDIEDRETSNPFYTPSTAFNSVVIPGVPTLKQIAMADERGFDGYDLYWLDGVASRKLALNEALRNFDRSFRLDTGYRMVELKPREVFRTPNNAEELLFRKGVIGLPAVRELAIQFGRAMAHARYSGWKLIEAEAPAIVGLERFYAMEDRKGRRVAAVMTRKDDKQRFFVMDWDAKRGQWRFHKISKRIDNMLRNDGAPNAPAFSKYHMLAAALNRMPVGFEGIGERFDEFVGYVNDGFYRELWRLAGYAYSDFPEIDTDLADRFLDTIEPLDVQDAVEWGDAAYGWAQELEQERVEMAEMRYTEQVWEAARIQAECELSSLQGEDGYADMLRERTDELVQELS